jgi:hypothetical protein
MLPILNCDNTWLLSKSWPFSYTKYKSIATQKVKILQHCLRSWTVNISIFNTLNAKWNPICHLLALLGAHPILHISRIRVKDNVRQNSTNVEYPNLHHKQNVPFMNMWRALQGTMMPEDHSISRLTQLNGAITGFHTGRHPGIRAHEWKSYKQSVTQFNQYL